MTITWKDGIHSEQRASARPSCNHTPPRSTAGQLGMVDRCKCGSVQYVLRYSGNDGSGTVRRRWDRWS